MLLALRQIVLGDNRFHRTHGNAGHAIDAGVVVDVDHLVVGVEAGHRANRDAFGETAQPTIVGHHDRHYRSPRDHLGRLGGAPVARAVPPRLRPSGPEIKHETL
jgi:hypothetical protein